MSEAHKDTRDMVAVFIESLNGADRVVVETKNALGEMDAHYMHAPAILDAWNTRQPQWQPIETAPKDGTEIAAWVGPGYVGGWLQLHYTKYNGAYQWRDWDEGSWDPTCWMPIPTPPEAD